MTREQMAAAFNEWMRRYTEDPAGFEAEFNTVAAFLAESGDGKVPTYGDKQAAYMESLVAEMSAVAA